jgi:hypothetical protein
MILVTLMGVSLTEFFSGAPYATVTCVALAGILALLAANENMRHDTVPARDPRVREQNSLDRVLLVLRRFDDLVPDINTTSLGASTMTPTKPGWYLARLKSRDYEDRESS